MEDLKYYPRSKIVLRKNQFGELQIVQLMPGCHPGEQSLSPKCLNNKRRKIVHSAFVKKISPHFRKMENPHRPLSPDYHSCYCNLSDELITQIIQQLDWFEQKMSQICPSVLPTKPNHSNLA